MSEKLCPIQFFLGANSPHGFVSRFDQLDDHDPEWHTYIIKGGPGCGKSTFMRRVAQEFAPRSPHMQLIPCSSDKDSLDAVLLPEWKTSIVDGTAPHVLEATYPAINQTLLSLGDFLDPRPLLPFRERIHTLCENSAENYKQAVDFLAAAGSFLQDSSRLSLTCTDLPKLASAVEHLAARRLQPIQLQNRSRKANEQVRFLSSISGEGLCFLQETVPCLCKDMIFIQDEWGAVSGLFLTALRSRALELGYDLIVCPCSMAPHSKIDHLIFPEIGLAFLTENPYHDLSALKPHRRIHARRFLDANRMRLSRKRFSYNRKAAQQFLEQAVLVLQENRALHNELETYYQKAMDFAPLDPLFHQLVQRILS